VKQSYASDPALQSGSANLLVTLVLSMLTALVTLTAAKTQLVEQQMATNGHWHTRLSLEARTQWSNAVNYLVTNYETMARLATEVQQESQDRAAEQNLPDAINDLGFLHFQGRLKRFLKAGGEMISLPALEEPFSRRFPADENGPRVAIEGA